MNWISLVPEFTQWLNGTRNDQLFAFVSLSARNCGVTGQFSDFTGSSLNGRKRPTPGIFDSVVSAPSINVDCFDCVFAASMSIKIIPMGNAQFSGKRARMSSLSCSGYCAFTLSIALDPNIWVKVGSDITI